MTTATITDLTPNEEAIYHKCLAKLRRSSTLPVRVALTFNDGATVTAFAFSQVYAEQTPPDQPKQPPRERLILSISAESTMAALEGLLARLG